MPAYNEISTDTSRFRLGSGTEVNPGVLWDRECDLTMVSAERRNVNEKIAWSVAKAYEKYNVARIRMPNHTSQYKRDLVTGRVVMIPGRNGKFFKATEKADSHLTVDLAIKNHFVDSVHIYTQDDDQNIPLRISLQSERVLTRPNGNLSPVLFRRSVPKRRPRTLNAELRLSGKQRNSKSGNASQPKPVSPAQSLHQRKMMVRHRRMQMKKRQC